MFLTLVRLQIDSSNDNPQGNDEWFLLLQVKLKIEFILLYIIRSYQLLYL
jgi:hypothetical protein